MRLRDGVMQFLIRFGGLGAAPVGAKHQPQLGIIDHLSVFENCKLLMH